MTIIPRGSDCFWRLLKARPGLTAERLIQRYRAAQRSCVARREVALERKLLTLRIQHRQEIAEPAHIQFPRQIDAPFRRGHSGFQIALALLSPVSRDKCVLRFFESREHVLLIGTERLFELSVPRRDLGADAPEIEDRQRNSWPERKEIPCAHGQAREVCRLPAGQARNDEFRIEIRTRRSSP